MYFFIFASCEPLSRQDFFYNVINGVINFHSNKKTSSSVSTNRSTKVTKHYQLHHETINLIITPLPAECGLTIIEPSLYFISGKYTVATSPTLMLSYSARFLHVIQHDSIEKQTSKKGMLLAFSTEELILKLLV